MYDLIIKQGKCADGSVMDIAVKEGKIAALGSLEHNATAARTLDCKADISSVQAGLIPIPIVIPPLPFITTNPIWWVFPAA